MRLSILVATNREKWIPWLTYQVRKLIKGNQRFHEIEVLVATEVSKKLFDSQFNVFYNDESIGAKRNFLISQATGEYMMFVDDDDWYPENRINTQFDLMMHHPDMKNKKGKCSTTDKFLCYHLIDHNYFICSTCSESSLMFNKEYCKNRKFGDTNKYEGNDFCDGGYALMIPNLCVAFTHKENTGERKCDEAPMQALKGMDKNEKEILKKTAKRLKLPRPFFQK